MLLILQNSFLKVVPRFPGARRIQLFRLAQTGGHFSKVTVTFCPKSNLKTRRAGPSLAPQPAYFWLTNQFVCFIQFYIYHIICKIIETITESSISNVGKTGMGPQTLKVGGNPAQEWVFCRNGNLKFLVWRQVTWKQP